MKTHIEVADRKEAKLLKVGLRDPQARALVKVIGALEKLPNMHVKRRVLRTLRVMQYVDDVFGERDGRS